MKLKNFKPLLITRNHEVFGNVHTNVTRVVDVLNRFQYLIGESGFNDSLNLEEKKKDNGSLNQALHVQDKF